MMGLIRLPVWQTSVATWTEGEEKAGGTVKLPAEWRERETERVEAFLYV
jgi:hypothetical protein